MIVMSNLSASSCAVRQLWVYIFGVSGGVKYL